MFCWIHHKWEIVVDSSWRIPWAEKPGRLWSLGSQSQTMTITESDNDNRLSMHAQNHFTEDKKRKALFFPRQKVLVPKEASLPGKGSAKLAFLRLVTPRVEAGRFLHKTVERMAIFSCHWKLCLSFLQQVALCWVL